MASKTIVGTFGALVTAVCASCTSSSGPLGPLDDASFGDVTIPDLDAGDDATSDATAPPPDAAVDQSTHEDAPVVIHDASVDADASAHPVDASVDAASEAEASTVVPTPAPDFLWYVLDETTGTTAHDSSSHHYDINVPGVTWSHGGIFDGQTACGSTTVGPAYRSAPITLSAWLTPAARTDQPTTYTLQPFPPNALSDDVPNAGGYGIGLNVWGSGSALAAEGVAPCTQAGLCAANATQNAAAGDAGDAGDGGLSCTSPTSCQQGFVAGSEYLVTLTVDAPPDGGTAPIAQVYVNGVLFDQDVAYIPAANLTPPLYLGCHNVDTAYGTARFFDGRIRDVRVYLRQLAADEVLQLFDNGPAIHAPPKPDAGVTDAATD